MRIKVGNHIFTDWLIVHASQYKELIYYKFCKCCFTGIDIIVCNSDKSFSIDFDISSSYEPNFAYAVISAIDINYTTTLSSYENAMEHIDSSLKKLNNLTLLL